MKYHLKATEAGIQNLFFPLFVSSKRIPTYYSATKKRRHKCCEYAVDLNTSTFHIGTH
jgi:hypothetical protein